MPTINEKPDCGISIALLKQGDRHTFAQFVSHYQDMVFACCRAVGLNGQDSEDAAAETFLAAWQAIGRFNGKSKLSSWLWSIAYHKAIDYRRKKTSCASLDESVQNFAAPGDRAVSLENDEQNQRLWHTVSHLPAPQAAAIVLYYREQKSIEEIAVILKIPLNTVKTHLHRGRKELYSQLQSVWENDYARK